MMNTIQIQKILENDRYSKKTFIGVFARDQLPIKFKLPCCFVINTDISKKPGQHWLAFYFNKNSECEFFDSMGFPPDFYNLNKYLIKVSKKFKFSIKPIQSFFSTYCGLYCVLFLLFRNRNITMNSFLRIFNKNPQKNDKNVEKMLKYYS